MQSPISSPAQSYVSFDSLIKAQEHSSVSKTDEAGKNAGFSDMVAEESRHFDNARRTAGEMPRWEENYDSKDLRSAYAPSLDDAQSSEIEDYIGRNNKAHRTFSEGELARKYVRESDPRYADVTVGDFVDIINPLQHIPLVSSIYRHVTGDEIKPPARIIGGGIFGGPLGMASAMVNSVVEDQTGKDIGENIASSFMDTEEAAPVVPHSFAAIEPMSGGDEYSGARKGTSFAEAKKAYAVQSGVLDIEWQKTPAHPTYEPIDISDSVTAERTFFSHDKDKSLSLSEAYDGQDKRDNNAAPDALAFGPGSFAAASVKEATTNSHGVSRTGGTMPSYSSKTLSIKPKDDLARELRMENPPAREPVTRVKFGQ